MGFMSWFLILLYALVLPYLGLMLMVLSGLLISDKRPYSKAKPSVSVIIPAHNEEDKIAATLKSLSQQRYSGPLEFVIVNDRSSDTTAEIIQRFVKQDHRFKLVEVNEPSKRLAPKVNAVNTGIDESSGEIILTSDADCRYLSSWVEGMASYFEADVAMVVGYVESTRPGQSSSLLERFESIDWLSLMFSSRSLMLFGWKFASSANNQAYRRSAFEAIGGFGAGGRAPSGDEDLLTQRMGKRQKGRIVFALGHDTRVYTQAMPNLAALLAQRRRWVSRYRHMLHYHPAFLSGIVILGFQSIFLSIAILLSFFIPTLIPYVFGLWAIKLSIELVGMYVGTKRFGRRDLWGKDVLLWAVAHPFFIATISIWALLRSGEWRSGAQSYRRRLIKRQWREWHRRVKNTISDMP